MQRKSGQDLTQGPVARGLFRLTAPMMLAISSSVIVQMIEIGFIGQLGTAQIAAVTFTFPITMMLTSVAMGVSIGTSSVIARRVGGGDWDDVRRFATHSLLLVGLLLSVLALIGVLTIRPVFEALGAHGAVLDYIHGYLLIYYPGTVLFTVTMVTGSTMRATGDARIPGLIMTGGAFLNLALDPILIFGWFGAPRLELTGAAVAMVLSRLVMTALLFYFAIAKDRLFLPLRQWRGNVLASWREVMVVGLPAMATQMIGPISGAIITRLLASHGHDVVAGFGVAGRIEGVAVMLLFALSGSIGPFVGQNWGKGDLERVHAGVRVAYQFSIAWGAFAWLVLMVIGDQVVPLIDKQSGGDFGRAALSRDRADFVRAVGRADDGLGVVQFARQTDSVDRDGVYADVHPVRAARDARRSPVRLHGDFRRHRDRQLRDGLLGLRVAEAFIVRVGSCQSRHRLTMSGCDTPDASSRYRSTSP